MQFRDFYNYLAQYKSCLESYQHNKKVTEFCFFFSKIIKMQYIFYTYTY